MNRAVLDPSNTPFLKVAEQAYFDAQRIQGILLESAKPYLEMQKRFESAIESCRPFLDIAVQQANRLNEIYQLGGFDNSGFLRQLTAMQDSIISLVKGAELPTLDLPPHDGIQNLVIPVARHHEVSGQNIADAVAEKVIAHIESHADLNKVLGSVDPVVKLPKNFRWSDITIQFINNCDVRIYYEKKFVGMFSHEKLGFVRSNTKEKTASAQWKFLQHLSIYSIGGKTKPTIEQLASSLKINSALCMKRKGKLAEQLQTCFGTKELPFHDYDADKGYQTKFKLLPESVLRNAGELWSSGGKYNENKDIRMTSEPID